MEYVVIKAKAESKKFFKAYSEVSGKIKKIEDLEGDKKDQAIKYLNTATDAMVKLTSLIGKKK